MVALRLTRRRITADMASRSGEEAAMDEYSHSLTSRYSDWIMEALDELTESFLITDPSIPGHPIVFASRGFLALSGYASGEVLGRNARIFQGPATDRRSVLAIREAIREERHLQLPLLNYRRDGSPHWILFHLSPVFSASDGGVVHFLAVQVPIQRSSSNASRSRSRCSSLVSATCRNELRGDSDFRCDRYSDSLVDSNNRGVEAEESREASDREKQKARSAANNIISVLARHSKLTGSAVSEKKCLSAGAAPLSASLNLSLGRIKQSFVLTDPHLPDMPIVYASDAFLNLTGYCRHEVLGHNCRFLGGPDTDMGVLNQIKDSLQAERACSVRLLNYRKNGIPFWNLLHISPVRNASGKIAFYVGVQIEEGSKTDMFGLSPEMRQLGAVGAVKVAVRSLSSGVGPSRSAS